MAKKLDAKGYRKFSMMDKLAYGAGDFACNMSFALKGYLMVFWTQYMGKKKLAQMFTELNSKNA